MRSWLIEGHIWFAIALAARGGHTRLCRDLDMMRTGVFQPGLPMSAYGTELPIPNVRSSVANRGKADKICSMPVLRILTHAVIDRTEIPQRSGADDTFAVSLVRPVAGSSRPGLSR